MMRNSFHYDGELRAKKVRLPRKYNTGPQNVGVFMVGKRLSALVAALQS